MKKNTRYRKVLQLMLVVVLSSIKLYGQQGYMIKYFHRGRESLFNKVSDSTYVSMTETTNRDYKLFLDHLLETGQVEEYNTHLPKSFLWEDKVDYSFSKEYAKNYDKESKFDYYPVVNISKESMDAYCSWLTQCYQESGKKYSKVIVRLPTSNEWSKMANPNNCDFYPWETNTVFIKCKKKWNCNCTDSCLIANIRVNDTISNYFPIGIRTVAQFNATLKIGFYDIIGNVAEMTEDLVIKGGSWNNLAHECYLEKVQYFEVPDPRVGFRILIEIIQR